MDLHEYFLSVARFRYEASYCTKQVWLKDVNLLNYIGKEGDD